MRRNLTLQTFLGCQDDQDDDDDVPEVAAGLGSARPSGRGRALTEPRRVLLDGRRVHGVLTFEVRVGGGLVVVGTSGHRGRGTWGTESVTNINCNVGKKLSRGSWLNLRSFTWGQIWL